MGGAETWFGILSRVGRSGSFNLITQSSTREPLTLTTGGVGLLRLRPLVAGEHHKTLGICCWLV